MAYLVGIVLSLGVALLARRVGFDRDRGFYSAVVIAVASYYVLFAVQSESVHALFMESLVMMAFIGAAVAGFRRSTWILVAGLAAHGVFDVLHGRVIENPGVPVWWPAFCMTYDVGAATWLAWVIIRRGGHDAHRAIGVD